MILKDEQIEKAITVSLSVVLSSLVIVICFQFGLIFDAIDKHGTVMYEIPIGNYTTLVNVLWKDVTPFNGEFDAIMIIFDNSIVENCFYRGYACEDLAVRYYIDMKSGKEECHSEGMEWNEYHDSILNNTMEYCDEFSGELV